jgi:hypothetical protein
MSLVQVWIGLLLQMWRAYNKSQLSPKKIKLKLFLVRKMTLNSIPWNTFKSKNYEITSKKPHISSNQRLFNNTHHVCPNFSKTFNRDFVEFIRQNHSIFNNSCIIGINSTMFALISLKHSIVILLNLLEKIIQYSITLAL